jgi:hypothetical protein
MRVAKPIPEMTDADAVRFWSGIVARELHECWPWRGDTELTCYGAFKINGEVYYRHRVAYYLEFGQVPDGKIVCHKCDRKGCCNPSHLYAGTHQTNAADRERARDLQGNAT